MISLGDDAPAILSVGTLIGGTKPPTKQWDVETTALAKRIIALREGIESSLNVNVVYQIPGELWSPNFTGVRTGSFSAARRLLIVQVAVPSGWPVDPRGLLMNLLSEAIEAAESYARRRKSPTTCLKFGRYLLDRVILSPSTFPLFRPPYQPNVIRQLGDGRVQLTRGV